MINVLKRLAELDAKNPNVQQVQNTKISESVSVAECGGMMGGDMQAPSVPHTPASIHITANTGEELSGMLQDIMHLAGVKQDAISSTDSQVLSATPVIGVSNPAANDMRAVIDKLNPDGDMTDNDSAADTDNDSAADDENVDDEEQVESYDNTPSDPNSAQPYDSEALAYHPNPPGAAKSRGLAVNPRGVPTMEEIEQRLYSAYQNYLNEEN